MSGRIPVVSMIALVAGIGLFCAGLAFAHDAHLPPPGSNTMLVAPLDSAPGLEVIISDVVIPPQTEVPPHTHPGEEFVYVIEGSVVQQTAGMEDRVIHAGHAGVIREGTVHSPRTTDQPARAIVFRVHPVGQPERIPAE